MGTYDGVCMCVMVCVCMCVQVKGAETNTLESAIIQHSESEADAVEVATPSSLSISGQVSTKQ